MISQVVGGRSRSARTPREPLPEHLRIGVFTESFDPVKNGVTTSVRTLVDELRSRQQHVYIVAPHYPDHTDELPYVLRVPSILTPLNADYAIPYPWFPRLKREIRKLQLDVVHSHGPWFLGLLATRVARRYGLPHISTYHTLYDQYAHYVFFLPGQTTLGILHWWMPEFYNACSTVIVPSRVAERSLRSYGVEAPVEIIPTGVPLAPPETLTAETRAAVRERFGVPADAPLLLYVGRLAKEKCIEALLEAFGQVAAEFPAARLLLVGAGPHGEALQHLSESLPGGDRVIFAGVIDRSELDPVYAAADLFVFPSGSETQGLVIAEARAAGTPSVVVREGGAAETVADGEEGLAVDSDASALAVGIRTLLADQSRLAAMRAACLRRAPLFTPAAMSERVERAYRAALAGHRAKGARRVA